MLGALRLRTSDNFGLCLKQHNFQSVLQILLECHASVVQALKAKLDVMCTIQSPGWSHTVLNPSIAVGNELLSTSP